MSRDPSAHSAASRKGRYAAEANRGAQVGRYRVQPGSTLANADKSERAAIMRWLKEQDKESAAWEASLIEEMNS